MPETITKLVYRFDELTPSAKERARDWFREGLPSEFLENRDDWEAVAAILGVTFDRHDVSLMGGGTRSEASIYWSGFASQGDGASWAGRYAYAPGSRVKIREYAPTDQRLHDIADRLAAVQRRYAYRLTASVQQRGNSVHEYSMAVDVDGAQVSEADAREVTDQLRAFAHWIYRQLEAAWEDQNSDESVDENIRANDYRFEENGERSRDA